MSVVKFRRSAFLATSSGSPGSWIGTSPPERASTLSARMSRAHTSWPSSAKQAAVTRPTQPTPMTPIGSLSMTAAGYLAAATRRARDGHHLLLRERLEQRVRDPVGRLGRAPGHEPQPVAREVQLVLPPPDAPRLGRLVEDRRVLPRGGLQAVVLAVGICAPHDHAVGAVLLVIRASQLVDAWRLGELRRIQEHGRVHHRKRSPGAGLHRLE